MTSIQNLALALFILAFSLDTRATEDNLKLTRYEDAASVPAAFMALFGNDVKMKLFMDDEGITRTDKKYYVSTHSYASSYRAADISKILNPSEGRIDTLFNDMGLNKTTLPNVFKVMMTIVTPVKNFDCESTLNFSSGRNVFTYRFSNFNMVFTDMAIQVVVEEVNGVTQVNLTQIAALKGNTFKKLTNTPFALGSFEKALKTNIRQFKVGVGGI